MLEASFMALRMLQEKAQRPEVSLAPGLQARSCSPSLMRTMPTPSPTQDPQGPLCFWALHCGSSQPGTENL